MRKRSNGSSLLCCTRNCVTTFTDGFYFAIALSWAGCMKLTTALRDHLLFIWDAHEGYDVYEEEIKRQLPPVLHAELCYHIYGRILFCNCPFLGWMHETHNCSSRSLALHLGR